MVERGGIALGRSLDAVLFDLDDTLHGDDEVMLRAADRVAVEFAREYSIDAVELRNAYTVAAVSFWENLTDRQLQVPLIGLRQQMWLDALHCVGIDQDGLALRAAQSYNLYRKDYLQLFPGVSTLLAALRERGIKLGLVTNGFAQTHREKIALLKLEDSFDEIFIADEVGMVKPDPRIFLYACERLGVRPRHTAMVGDRFERDIRGAQAAGLVAIWFNVSSKPVPDGEVCPDAIVVDIQRLSDVLTENYLVERGQNT